MAPDHIYEIALLGVSRWQRQAMEKLMSINCTCPEHVDHFECLKPEKFGPFSRPLLSRGRKMWRKDVQDTIDSCKEAETPFDLYLMGDKKPHYPLPTTERTRITSTSWVWLVSFCPKRKGAPCSRCGEQFKSEIEWIFFPNDEENAKLSLELSAILRGAYDD